MWERSATKPVPDGAKITLETDRQEYFLGENILVHFILTNTGAQPFEAEFGGDYRGSSRHLRFKVTATDEAGNLAEDPDPNPMCFGGMGGPRTLKPGEKFIQSLPLMRYRRIIQPGRYTITAKHDFGWKEEGERKRPIGVTTITLRLPDASQTESVVTQMEKLPENPDSVWGQKTKEYADFSCLCQPVYLEPLIRRARAGNLRALAGIGSMATTQATQALIEMANAADAKLALDAALTLNGRLPDPEFKKELPGRGPFRFDAMESRRRLAEKSYDDKFTSQVRALAVKFLGLTETREIGCGAFMIQAVGTPDEAPAVIAALDRVLDPMVRPRHDANDNILDFPEPLPELMRAMQSLHKRGFTLNSGGLSGNAQIMLWFAWLQNEPGPRPQRWLEMAEAFGTGSHYPLNEAVVRSIPSPMPLECAKFVEGALADRDYGVCRAACEVAGKSGRKEFYKPLLEIIATEPHEWLFRAAADAARDIATSNTARELATSDTAPSYSAEYDLLEACADRLDDEHLYPIALDYLQTIFEGLPGGWSGRTDLTRSERLELRKQWKAFLTAHAADLRANKKFKLTDPALSGSVAAALFGHARSFQLPDGKIWPPPATPAQN
ncbi:MAG: hypothetical protein NTX50_11695 [Candidatus Sumerlaeota bacterium]|nr:hypothetical protein [Candidatus Sumerlaeota bacterium]